MSVRDVCKNYNISDAELDQYAVKGILFPDDEADDCVLDKISTILLLRSAGLETPQIVCYFTPCGGDETKVKILRNARAGLLDAMHDRQKILSKIDYLIYNFTRR